MCTKTSLDPSSGWMKPNPLALLKNFTVPVDIYASRSGIVAGEIARGLKLPMGEDRKSCP
jgi:hypothetical protein